MMNYYKVTAKCGHVGRNNYIPIDFYVTAESATEAASIVRWFPRVKHHQKDAIVNVCKVSLDAYLEGKQSYRDDPFIHCTNNQQQKEIFSQIVDRILPEVGRIPQETEKTPRNAKRSQRYGYDRMNRLQTKRPFRYDSAEMPA